MAQYRNTKAYVVSWLSFFDNEIHIEIIDALHEYHALELSNQDLINLWDMHELTDMQLLHDRAFDRDGVFSVLEIK